MDKALHANDTDPQSPEVSENPEADAQQQLLADFEQLKAALAQMQEERLRERAELDNQPKPFFIDKNRIYLQNTIPLP